MDETATSGLRAVGAVEVEPRSSSTMFVHGICIGIAAGAILVHVWFAVQLATYREVYANFRDDAAKTIGALTRLAISSGWLQGVPVGAALAIVALLWKRPRRVAPYVVLAAALVVTAVGTYWYATAPARDVFGKISAE